MLSKGLRDQESMRIDAILKQLRSLVLVPKTWDLEDKSNLEELLKDFGLSIQSLIDCDEKDIVTHLVRFHLDWNQLEQFADFLVMSSSAIAFDFTEKAIAIYTYIQQESKMFSFGINSKIVAAKAKL